MKKILLASVLMLSTTGNATELEIAGDLQRQLPPEEISMLKTAEQEFLTLELKTMTPFTKGTVILIPDWSQHAASPRAINFLRTTLIDYGWNTIAMMVPEALSAVDSETLLAYQTEFQGRLAAVLKRAASKHGNLIIVAQGSSGALINTMIQREQISAPQGLILLSAYLSDAKLNQAVSLAISQHKIPTLDIMHNQDNSIVAASSKIRLQLTRKSMKELYRQRILTGAIDDEPEWLFKEVYGWLTYIGY